MLYGISAARQCFLSVGDENYLVIIGKLLPEQLLPVYEGKHLIDHIFSTPIPIKRCYHNEAT